MLTVILKKESKFIAANIERKVCFPLQIKVSYFEMAVNCKVVASGEDLFE